MADEPAKQSYGLIRGVFSPDDARELLLTLIDNKISFHQLNNRSRRERFGEIDPAVVKRVDELRQSKADIATLIEEMGALGMKLSISCNIEITPVKEWFKKGSDPLLSHIFSSPQSQLWCTAPLHRR